VFLFVVDGDALHADRAAANTITAKLIIKNLSFFTILPPVVGINIASYDAYES
jgi:hypothetical protein